MKPATKIAVVLLGLVAFIHLLRLVLGWEVLVAGYVVPVWISFFGLVIPGGLAFLVVREHQA